MEDLEACPDVDAIAKDLDDEKDRLARLNRLADVLGSIKSVNNPKFIEDAYPLAAALGVNDAPPPRPQRVKKTKQKQASAGPRKPYWTFTSADGVDIRVGRTSSDNDEVSCNPDCRDSKDWWMHAAGCPGSHVVIRYTGDDGPPRETVTDAALLAAVNSKSTQTGKAKVSMVRCRQVSKPRGAKPGLVQLSGDVRTVSVCVKDEADRLERLTATKS
jgi:predicted ribosome quality control (RQC) complex YloA/Tae2 family protein